MPMFHSQTAIAYNPALVPNPPKTYEELVEWVKENPEPVRLQRHQGRHVGRQLRHGLGLCLRQAMPRKLMNGPFDESASKAEWDKALADLKDFNKNVTLTPGNAGTLDMLNRGEIAMGPVWVDMFYTWQADGRLPPEMKLTLTGPGMPGQPMHYVVPAKARPTRNWPRSSWRSPPARRCRPKASSSASTGIPASTLRTSSRSSTRRPGTSCSSIYAGGPGHEGQAVPDRALFRRDPRSLREQGRELSGKIAGPFTDRARPDHHTDALPLLRTSARHAGAADDRRAVLLSARLLHCHGAFDAERLLDLRQFRQIRSSSTAATSVHARDRRRFDDPHRLHLALRSAAI